MAPLILSRANGRISVDFSNHDVFNLGGVTGGIDWSDGSKVPCSVSTGIVPTFLQNTYCKLKVSQKWSPPSVIIDFSGEASDFVAGTCIEIHIGRWKNPSAANTTPFSGGAAAIATRVMMIRLRYFTFAQGNTILESVSGEKEFIIAQNASINTNNAVLTVSGGTAGKVVSVSFDTTGTTYDVSSEVGINRALIIMMPGVNWRQKRADMTAASSASVSFLEGGMFIFTDPGSRTISESSLQLP